MVWWTNWSSQLHHIVTLSLSALEVYEPSRMTRWHLNILTHINEALRMDLLSAAWINTWVPHVPSGDGVHGVF